MTKGIVERVQFIFVVEGWSKKGNIEGTVIVVCSDRITNRAAKVPRTKTTKAH